MCQTHHIDVNSYFRNLLANENILYVLFRNLLANEELLISAGEVPVVWKFTYRI